MKERVRKEEEKGVTAAAALFLDIILQLEAEGWLRGFLDALAAAGGFPLVSVVSSASPFPCQSHSRSFSWAAQHTRDVKHRSVILGYCHIR